MQYVFGSLQNGVQCFTFLGTVSVIYGDSGGGDIKLAFVLGIWLNFPQTLWAALSAFWLGGFWGLTILLKGTAQRYIAFGPFLAIGALLAFLFGTDLYAIYRSLFYV